MASVNLTTYDEVLKTFYLPAIREQLNHSTILADIIDTNETDVSGKDATINMHYGRTTGTGARAAPKRRRNGQGRKPPVRLKHCA